MARFLKGTTADRGQDLSLPPWSSLCLVAFSRGLSSSKFSTSGKAVTSALGPDGLSKRQPIPFDLREAIFNLGTALVPIFPLLVVFCVKRLYGAAVLTWTGAALTRGEWSKGSRWF